MDGLVLPLLSGLKHVIACHHGQYRILTGIPVRDKHALPSPFLTHHRIQQLAVLKGIGAIELIVGCHDCPGLSFLHHHLESPKIEFTQSTL